MTDPRPERLAVLRRCLAAQGLDALLVSHLPNIRYLTGFSGTSALLVVTSTGALFLSDFRYRTQAGLEVGDLADLVISNGSSLWERLFKALPEASGLWSASSRPRSVGYESHVVTARDAQRLADPAQPWRSTATVDIVEQLRAVKSPEEIEAIRAAGALATGALEEAVAGVRAGQTELEVAAVLEGALRRRGSEGHPFPTIIASGPRTALPHARTSSRVIAPGDWLLCDFGAVVDGYCSDVSRTFVVGARATGRQAEVYEIVRAAQRAALTGLRAGMTGREGDALARRVIEAAGCGDAFGHSLGHGLGLEVHEAPRLARSVDAALPAAAVVTVEPGLYLPDWGGVRIEDDVVLTDAGAELLTEFPRELTVLT